MGAQLSKTGERDQVNLDRIVDNTNKELGDLDLFEQIEFNAAGDEINNAQKLYITSIELGDLFDKSYSGSRSFVSKVIASAEIFFQPKVCYDEKVARAHFS